MSSGISPANEQYIQELVARGEFHDRAEALDEAVQLLKQQREQREQLIRDVNFGVEQAERGESGPLDMEKIKARVAERYYAETKEDV